jgi:hypothetical protein
MSLTKVSYSMIAGAPINILDFGASPSASSAVNTAAIQAAIDYAGGLGGGTVIVPDGVFAVSELSFKSWHHVLLQGSSPAYNYGNAKSTSVLSCTTGTWAVRFPYLASYCGLQDLAIQSNGVVNTTSPYIISTPGVEYGVFIEVGATFMFRVTVYGFQYGCTIAQAGNSNLFEECGFIWNTRVGFAVTGGGAAGYAAYHPNIPYVGSIADSTVYTVRNCNMRRNGWGQVLRDGGGTFHNALYESNIFGGLLEWAGSLDVLSGGGGNFYDSYFESNWQSFDPAAITWRDSAVINNNYLKNTAGTYITLADNATNALSDFGYQVTMGGETPGSVAQGPSYQLFSKMAMIMTDYQKGIFLKQGYNNQFNYPGGASALDPTATIRLGAAGGFTATGTYFFQSATSTPLAYNGIFSREYVDLSSEYGGLTMLNGFRRGLAGNVTYFATPTPYTITASGYNAAAAAEQSSFIANYAGTVTITFRPATEVSFTGSNAFTAATTPNAGRWLYIKTVTANTVVSATSNIVPIDGTSAGTAILPGTAGAWAALQSDGTNWIVMARGT